MNNERGGIISTLFIIPIGVALMVGFFFLGYYVGKYQNKTPQNEAQALPEIVAKNLPSKEEFTFYKTLTDKNDKTVSIDLKPKPGDEEKKAEKKPAVADAPKSKPTPQPQKEKQVEINIEKEPAKQQKAVPSKPMVQAKKEPAPQASSNAKIRYTLQIASYPEKEAADNDVKKMKQRGYAAFIVAAEVPSKGTWYRVRLGSFSNKSAAEKLQKQVVAKEGISPIIVME